MKAKITEEGFSSGCEQNPCRVWTQDANSNCRLAYCLVLGGCHQTGCALEFGNGYNNIKFHCADRDGSGGVYDNGVNHVEVLKNPDFVGSSIGSRSSLDSLADTSAEVLTKRDDSSGLISYEMPLEVFEAYVANETGHPPEDGTPNDVEYTDSKIKRQADTWTTWASGVGPKSDERIQVSHGLSNGATQTWEFSESISIGVEVSAEISAGFFDIFSASVGISTSMETTEQVSQGLQFSAGNCPRDSVIYWEPIMNWWDGYFNDDIDNVITIWTPRELRGYAEGRFVTVCLG